MSVKYYDVQKNWSKKIAPLMEEPFVKDTLHKDFGKFAISRCGRPFKDGDVPAQFDCCDWRYNRRGRRPAFWDYVCHSACHWLVNLNLRLAVRTEPKKQWHILTSDLHSTVFDGVDTLFDMNFLALGVKAEEAYKMVTLRKNCGRKLKVGSEQKTYYFGAPVASVTERALRAMKGHPDYYTYLSVCHEWAVEKRDDTNKHAVTHAELDIILDKLRIEDGQQ